jgi:hypothetical protein
MCWSVTRTRITVPREAKIFLDPGYFEIACVVHVESYYDPKRFFTSAVSL